MSYDQQAFLRHQVQRGMSFAALCRAYGASPNEMRQTLQRAGLLRSVLPEDLEPPKAPKADPDPIPAELAARLSPLQRDVYRLLRRAAAEGELCPSNIEISQALDVEGCKVQQLMSQLLYRDAIRMRVVRQRRVVEILETGQETAEPPQWVRPRRVRVDEVAA